MTKNSRRNWRAEDAVAKAAAYLSAHTNASGSDIAKLLGVAETQGKTYRRLAMEELALGRAQTSPDR